MVGIVSRKKKKKWGKGEKGGSFPLPCWFWCGCHTIVFRKNCHSFFQEDFFFFSSFFQKIWKKKKKKKKISSFGKKKFTGLRGLVLWASLRSTLHLQPRVCLCTPSSGKNHLRCVKTPASHSPNTKFSARCARGYTLKFFSARFARGSTPQNFLRSLRSRKDTPMWTVT